VRDPECNIHIHIYIQREKQISTMTYRYINNQHLKEYSVFYNTGWHRVLKIAKEIKQSQPGIVVHTYNPNTQKVEAGRSQVQSQPGTQGDSVSKKKWRERAGV
jgi:hypothetical protein